MGTRNTRKQVTQARKQSVYSMETGQWLREFNHWYDKTRNAETKEMRRHCLDMLKLKFLSYGLRRFPELRQYGLSKIEEFDPAWVERMR